MRVLEGQQTLEDAGLVVRLRLTENAEVPGFHIGVSGTEPAAGSLVPYGSTVELFHDQVDYPP